MVVTEENAVRNLAANIRNIMRIRNITKQKDLAECIKIPEATLSTFLKKAENEAQNAKLPSVYPFIANLSNFSGFSLDSLINEKIETSLTEDADSAALDLLSLRGIYHFYYLDSSPFAGHEYEVDSKSLRFGILLIYGNSGEPDQRALLLAGLSRKDMADTVHHYKVKLADDKTYNSKRAYTDLKAAQGNFHGIRVFEGSVTALDKDFVFYDLNCCSFSKDHLSMLFYYQNPNQDPYIGGLGEGISISRGQESTPCAQLFGTSKYELDISNEQIVQALLLPLTCPDLSPADEDTLRALVHKVSAYYSQSRNLENSIVGDHLDNMFSEDDIRLLIGSNLRKIIIDMMVRNHQRSFKITGIDDNRWYHLIKSCIGKEG